MIDDKTPDSQLDALHQAGVRGIRINLSPQPFDTVVGAAFNSKDPAGWQLAEWGSWTYDPDYLPTGETLFETGAPNNAGGYSDHTNDSLTNATVDARTPAGGDGSSRQGRSTASA